MMPKRLYTLYPFSVLLLGLILAQVLATVHVYLSNTNLYDSLTAIKAAGYLAVPNPQVMDRLSQFKPAFCGGLFFTFSIGAGISFLSFGCAWIWERLFNRKKSLLYLFLLLWFALLIVFNIHGFKPVVNLYFLVIPPAVFTAAVWCMFHLNRRGSGPKEIIHIVPVIVLAILLSWQIDSRMFTDFRDIFLLSNPVGSRINSFYYRYTLYPAEAFKSLDQKMLKTCSLEKIKNDASARSLENILINYDYIPIGGNRAVDLEADRVDGNLILTYRSDPILKISFKEFFAHPDKAIQEFARKSDGYAFFRRFVFFSLLAGFPLAVYVIMHGLISLAGSLFLNLRTSLVLSSVLCFAVGLLLMFSFHIKRDQPVSVSNLEDALSADQWQKRVAALKQIDEKNLDVRRFQAYPRLLTSPYIAERYWLVKTLANSRDPAAYQDLTTFLNDPHLNIRSMALYALGRMGNRQAIDQVMHIMETSDDWYSQWYAYRALRSLGWKQKKLN
jgi:hypothetical protein